MDQHDLLTSRDDICLYLIYFMSELQYVSYVRHLLLVVVTCWIIFSIV